VSASLTSSALTVGEVTGVAATIRDARGNAVTERQVSWTTSTSGIATITQTGPLTATVHADAEGATEIRAVLSGTIQSEPLLLTVGPAAPVPVNVEIGLDNTTLELGQTTTATAVVKDQNGVILPDQSVEWHADGPAVTVTSTGPLTADITGNSPGSSNVQATLTALGTAHSNVVAVTVTQTATQLVFTQQPGNTTVGSPFVVKVAVEDASGRAVPSYASPVSIGLGDNPGGAILVGAGAVTPVNGIATFSVLSLDKPALGYTLAATSDNLTGSSQRFDVSARPPSAIQRVTASEDTSCEVNTFGCRFVVLVTNDLGEPVAGAKVRWSSGNPTDGCPQGTFIDAPSDASGFSTATNVCEYPTPGTYQQTGTLIVNKQPVPGAQVTYIFTLTPPPAPPTRQVAYATVNVNDGSDIYGADISVIDDNTGSGSRIFDVSIDMDPTWSPDGSRLAFGCVNSEFGGCEYSFDIDVMNATDGSDRIDLTNTPDDLETSPAWSPDGTRIAFASVPAECEFNCSDIYVMNSADGQGRRDVSNNPDADEFSPAWSPDGTRIAFVVESGEGCFGARGSITIVNADGSGSPQTFDVGDVDSAGISWSADNRIAYGNECDGDIYAVNADGSGRPLNLTRTPDVLEFDPAWSPEGKLAFVVGGAPRDIWVMDIDGTRLNLTRSAGDDDLSPAWGPVDPTGSEDFRAARGPGRRH
jgi:Tol biopolymer transport system component